MNRKQKKMLCRVILTTMMVVLLNIIPLGGIARFVAFLCAYLMIGYDILRKAALGIIHGRLLDENFLMAIATVGAFGLAIYTGNGDYNEAVAVMLFYQIGELFQSCAVGKSRKSIGELMDIRPEYANIEIDGKIERVSPEEVSVGSIITVGVGERIALDGVVVEGRSTLDTSALTGESLPREIGVGEAAVSGCINMESPIRIRTEKEYGESAVAKILELVENASSRKSRSESFISRFAAVYTPVVCGAALALAVIPSLVGWIVFGDADVGTWIYRALTFLVISCPCALVISIPLSFFAGIGAASREGILIKGSNYLEALSETRSVVFDKTGTLTEGRFKVSFVECTSGDREMILEYAAHAECFSSHPLAKSIISAYGKEPDRRRVGGVHEQSGGGVSAIVDGHGVLVGNKKLMDELGIAVPRVESEGTCVYVAIDGGYAAFIGFFDTVKSSSKKAIDELRRCGVERIVMLTGDSRLIADAVGAELSIDEVRAELMPEDKVAEVERLLEKKNKRDKLVFVGDGINDAPVLARADIGIAMGKLGSDAAIEAADVVLMKDDILGIPKAIGISKRTLRIVKQNIVFSLAIKFLCLALVAMGFADMWLGIFADVGVMVIAVLNSVRAQGKIK